jgi:antitoxin HicB
MKKSRGHFNIVLRAEPEGGFTTMVPILPGCVTHGRNKAEAKKMASDGISGYLESLRKHKEPIPTFLHGRYALPLNLTEGCVHPYN